MLNTPCHNPLRIAGTVKDSIVDGPGLRYVIFTQGCPHHCVGCHNPETHDFEGGRIADTEEILEEIFSNPILSGVTFSGGEPFCQPEALLPIAVAIKEKKIHLMIFTGYLLEKLQKMENEIANSRKYYNGVVKSYNIKCQSIPSNIVASMAHFTVKPLFEITNEVERANVKVQF